MGKCIFELSKNGEFMNKYIRFLKDSKYRFNILDKLGFYRSWSDEKYLKKCYKLRLGRPLDLSNPKTFNEKLQWLKLYNRQSIYTNMVDKYSVKKIVADKIGEEYIIPTLGVWNSFDEIDFDTLPEQFVLKCTHDSGGLAICRDKSKFDVDSAKQKIEKSLNRNYYYYGREWPYKDVKPRIIAEKYMEDKSSDVLNVYKIFTFDGEPKIIQAIQGDKTASETIDYFDTEWNFLNMRQNFPNSTTHLHKPETLPKMLELARVLAKGVAPFLRVDFYEINGEVYFSEFTFYSDSGMARFDPEEWDLRLGEMIKLPTKDV